MRREGVPYLMFKALESNDLRSFKAVFNIPTRGELVALDRRYAEHQDEILKVRSAMI